MPPTYAPLGSRATAAILALYVAVGAAALAIGADVRRIVIAGDLEGGRVLVDELLGADQLVNVATLLVIAAGLIAAVLVVRWQLVAHRNLPALGEPAPRVGVGAGAVAWFVPGLNLVRPARVLGELWRAGERDAALPGLLRTWWATWVLAVLAVVLAWTVLGDAADVSDRQRIDGLRALATALAAAAAGLTIAVVTSATARQEARAVVLEAPRAARPEPELADGSKGDLPVVSEEQARRRSAGP